MDEKTALKQDMESRRASISHTIDELENRVHPGRVTARGKYRVRQQVTSWKDNIMGAADDGTGRMKDRMSGMADTAGQAPQQMVSKAKGNPLAAGLIAVGAGAIIGGLLPTTRQEERMVEDMQPDLNRAASEVREAGMSMAEDVKESVSESVEHVKESVKSSAQEMTDQAKSDMGSGQHTDSGDGTTRAY